MKLSSVVALAAALLQVASAESEFSQAVNERGTYSSSYGDTSFGYKFASRKPAHPVCHVNPTGKTRSPTKLALSGTKPKTNKDAIVFAKANRQNFRAQFENIDFTFNVFAKMEAGKVGGGGRGTIVSVDDVPALKDEGVGMVYFELEPCGLILPHAHPRATELIFVVDGEKLQVGFTEETNSRFIVNEISTGQMVFVPQGLLHYSQNVGCSKVILVGFFNHENPGSWFLTQRLFDLPLGVSAAALDIDEHLAKQLSDGLPDVSPVKGRPSCLKKCELPQDYMAEKYTQKPEPEKYAPQPRPQRERPTLANQVHSRLSLKNHGYGMPSQEQIYSNFECLNWLEAKRNTENIQNKFAEKH